MPARLATLIGLLHRAPRAALATHSASLPGFPFASAVAFVPDEYHRPVMLMSGLAEHSRNLQQDSRASLMVAEHLGEGEIARATLVGEIAPCAAVPELTQRYLRYHPDAQRLLALGDFGFARLEPMRMQVIGGFARAGWIDGDALDACPHLAPDVELQLLRQLAALLPAPWSLIGVDVYGADLDCRGRRERIVFPAAPVRPEDLPAVFAESLERRPPAPAAGDRDNAG